MFKNQNTSSNGIQNITRMPDAKRLKFDPSAVERIVPVLPDDLVEETPLVNVYIDEIADPKTISKVIVELNSCLPIPELTHLKRVRGRLVLLCPVNECEPTNVYQLLSRKGFDVGYLSNNVKVVPVAQIPPKVRKQYTVVNNLWPCNFHSTKYLEKLSTNTLFTDAEIDKHEVYMRVAITVFQDVVHSERFKGNKNAVVIVDPKIDSVVAVGYDNLEEGPCQHAVMVAVDNVAKTQGGGAWFTPEERSDGAKDSEGYDTSGIPPDMLRLLRSEFPDLRFGATQYKDKFQLESPTDGPYLCTGYYAYCVLEPCVMCSMALVHSRIKRTFYIMAAKNGGLGTLCKVHAVKDLNHHFEVFSGVLRHECANRFSMFKW